VTDHLAIRPDPSPPRAYQFPRHTKQTLATGATSVCATVSRLPLVSVAVMFRNGGAMHDPVGREGLASLTAAMLQEGTTNLDGSALAERFEDLGTTVRSVADWDGVTLTATVNPARLQRLTALLRDVIQAPTFPEREWDRLREEHRAERLQLVAEPRSLADSAFEWICYAGESRYRRPMTGTTASVNGVSRNDVATWWSRRYGPSEITVVFAGDVTAEQAAAHADALSRDWNVDVSGVELPAQRARTESAGVHLVGKRDAAQSELRVGHVAVPRRHADYFPLTVMNAILGGLFSSRINLNLRERDGYTYGAHSGFDWRRGPGPFVVSTAVNTEAAGAATREILNEIDRMRADLVTVDELSLATSYLAGVFPLRFETTTAVAAALAMQETFGLESDYFDTYRDAITAVTREDIRRAAATHLHPERVQIVAVGDSAALMPQLDALGLSDVQTYTSDNIEAAP
jgi:zinc protease